MQAIQKLTFIILILFLATAFIYAQTSQLINYQGKLTGKDGQALTGIYKMTFRIYPNETDDIDLWRETQDSVSVNNGVFNVILGQKTTFPTDLFAKTGDRYLGITLPGDLEMKPRFQMTSVAYAIHANSAKSLCAADGEPMNSVFVDANGNVGIGTNNPSERLEIQGGKLRFQRIQIYTNEINMYDKDNLYIQYCNADADKRHTPAGNTILNYYGGNVGIGKLPDSGYRLDINGKLHADGCDCPSDERLKKNIKSIDNCLEKLEKINGVSFEWKSKNDMADSSKEKREFGVIAQEVETVFPELVTSSGLENYKSVDYAKMAAVFVEAIKELKAENDQLKQRIEKLEQK